MDANKELHLEGIIYYQLSKKIDSILMYSAVFNLDYRLVASILFVERIQYDLPSVYSALQKVKCTFIDMVNLIKLPCIDEKKEISDWLNFSRGFSHIKWHTARKAYKLIDNSKIYSNEDFANFAINDDISIKIQCIILMLHIQMWKQDYPNIDKVEGVPILATIFNISNFENKLPHANPRVGGSILDHICDGVYYKNLSFGERVNMTYQSLNMQSFVKIIQDKLVTERNKNHGKLEPAL